jgi:hypothetical protein
LEDGICIMCLVSGTPSKSTNLLGRSLRRYPMTYGENVPSSCGHLYASESDTSGKNLR